MPEKRKYIDLDKWDPRVERKIVVAVDFGTTFSGIAFAQTAKTLRALEDPGRFTKAFGAGLLDQKAKRIPQHLSAEKLTTDYLKCLRQHTLNHLGNRLAKAVLHTTPIEWCLTMPAIWSDAAKARTRECAKQAFGPTSLHFLNEPEAAILYAMSTIDPKYTKVGNTYIICDCGGETVDLISYQITRVEPKIEVAETVPGSGGLCGSNFLNRRFQRLLKQKLANAPGNEENGAYAIDEALDRFEVLVKKSYRDTSESFKFPVNGLGDAKDIGIKRGMLVIHASELAQVFNPVIDEIVELVRAQISKNVTVNGVLLVGGFGQNGLLRERIRDAIAHEIEVIQPPDAYGSF
ncbi:MAG: hypothetical protein M1833_004512 [Piccolia ochrophora]|nr:MAG: hypothetical protein M1833_004512 [Piccolia ochrophora]